MTPEHNLLALLDLYHTRANAAEGNMDCSQTINNIIATRVTYGLREEVKRRGYSILAWSNCSASWRVRKAKPGSVKLDANEILVPLRESEVTAVLDQLDPLPLYANSTEARERDG